MKKRFRSLTKLGIFIERYTEWSQNVFLYDMSANTKNNLFEHTLVHEIGHILGLRHRSEPECVMTSIVESTSLTDKQLEVLASKVTKEFCPSELDLLHEIREIPIMHSSTYLQPYYTRTIDF